LETNETKKEFNVFVAGSLIFKHLRGDMRLYPLESLAMLACSEIAKKYIAMCTRSQGGKSISPESWQRLGGEYVRSSAQAG
jgi:hypothetical protein